MPWSPRHHNLRFVVEHDADRAIVRLAGELDCASAAVAHLALERAGPDLAEVTLDLSRVVFLDAAGVRFLLSAQRRARAADRCVVIRRPSRSVRRMLELTGVASMLAVEDGDDRASDEPPTRELVRIFERAIELAMGIVDADCSTARLLDRASGELRIVAHRGFNRTFLDYLELVSDTESVCVTAVRRGRPVWVPDLARSSVLADTPAVDVLLDAGIRAIASIPVECDRHPVAGLSLYHRVPTRWSIEQQIGLEQLTRSVARELCAALRLQFGVTSATAV